MDIVDAAGKIRVIGAEDDPFIAQMNQEIFNLEPAYTFSQARSVRGVLNLVDEAAAERSKARAAQRTAWAGRLVIALDGQLIDTLGEGPRVTEETEPELFADEVVQRAQADGSPYFRAILVARHAIRRFGAGNVAFVANSASDGRDGRGFLPDYIYTAEELKTNAGAFYALPKPWMVDQLLGAINRVNVAPAHAPTALPATDYTWQ